MFYGVHSKKHNLWIKFLLKRGTKNREWTGEQEKDKKMEINRQMGNEVTDKPRKGFKLGLVINFFSLPACLFHVFVKLSSLSKQQWLFHEEFKLSSRSFR